jgi:hypothetical protein
MVTSVGLHKRICEGIVCWLGSIELVENKGCIRAFFLINPVIVIGESPHDKCSYIENRKAGCAGYLRHLPKKRGLISSIPSSCEYLSCE